MNYSFETPNQIVGSNEIRNKYLKPIILKLYLRKITSIWLKQD